MEDYGVTGPSTNRVMNRSSNLEQRLQEWQKQRVKIVLRKSVTDEGRYNSGSDPYGWIRTTWMNHKEPNSQVAQRDKACHQVIIERVKVQQK